VKAVRQGHKSALPSLGRFAGGNATAEALATPQDFFNMFDLEILIHAVDAAVKSRTTGWVQPVILIQ